MRCSRSVAPQVTTARQSTATRIRIFQASHRAPLLLFLGVFLFSGLSPVGTSFDSRWSVYTAMSLWTHGDTNLDEYRDVLREAGWYGMECVDAQGNVAALRS